MRWKPRSISAMKWNHYGLISTSNGKMKRTLIFYKFVFFFNYNIKNIFMANIYTVTVNGKDTEYKWFELVQTSLGINPEQVVQSSSVHWCKQDKCLECLHMHKTRPGQKGTSSLSSTGAMNVGG